jgi:hypothetical protein
MTMQRMLSLRLMRRLLLVSSLSLIGVGLGWMITPAAAAPGDVSPDAVWTELGGFAGLSGPAAAAGRDVFVPPAGTPIFQLDRPALQRMLDTVPLEFTDRARSEQVVLTLPTPDGAFARFRVLESPILSPELAARHPELRTYLGQGLDDPTASVRFDLTPRGFHAMVLSAEGTWYVDPETPGQIERYASYRRADLTPPGGFTCHFEPESVSRELPPLWTAPPSGATLRTYRLAMTATGEYTNYFGGVTQAQAALTTTVNRVTGIYERDLAIRLNIVFFNIYADSLTDPFPDGDKATLQLTRNQEDLDDKLGPENYDIGHIVSRGGGGGLASFGVCASNKARGGTSSHTPEGDPFDVDYVAHEMGHQFHADHTFNGTTSSCGGGNRVASSAYEPGSGSTIMAYAGICDTEDLQPHSDPYFHTRSFDQITDFREGGGTCGVATSTGNTPPSVSAGPDYTIPRETPFTLTAVGADPDGDAITYCWEEYDLGAATPPDNTVDGPLFRSFNPTTSPSRTFPRLSNIVSGISSQWERLPIVDRTMDFRCTVRDNRAGGGGVNYDMVTVTVAGDPFAVTYPNGGENLTAGSPVTVTWTVGGGSVASEVNILLSTDGGSTFDVLAAGVPNDGAQEVTLSCTETTRARIRVEAVDNIFFDLSDTDFRISDPEPVISAVTVNGGAVDAGCEFTVTFSATVGDNCDLPASAVDASVALLTGNATLGTPVINKSQVDGKTVAVSGSVLVSGLTGSPATVRVTVSATDVNGHFASASGEGDVSDTTPPQVICPPDVVVECTSYGGTPADDPQLASFFSGAAASDNCDPSPTIDNDAPSFFDVGATPVVFTATDASGNASSCTAMVTVVDTTPPEIMVELNRNCLWSPNHKLAEIEATVTVTDVCDPNPTFLLRRITSNEPDDEQGDGHTIDDIQDAEVGSDDTVFSLRSERMGGGEGRVYTIIYKAMDAHGNESYDTTYVRVPHDRGGGAVCATGFAAGGLSLDESASSYTLVIPSGAGFDASRVLPLEVYVGNILGVVKPDYDLVTEVTGDGLPDLLLMYDGGTVRRLAAASSDLGSDPGKVKANPKPSPLGLHYRTVDGTDYLVPDILALGEPITISTLLPWGAGSGSGAPEEPGPGTDPSTAQEPGTLVLPASGPVVIEVYNVLGQRVRTLVNEDLTAGTHRITWDGRDGIGRTVPSGMYFYRIQAPGLTEVKKVFVVR